MKWNHCESDGCRQDHSYSYDRTREVAFELVLERKGRIRRKVVQAAEAKGENAEHHGQATHAPPVVHHAEPSAPDRRQGARRDRGDQITKGPLPRLGVGLSSRSPAKDFKQRCDIITFFSP